MPQVSVVIPALNAERTIAQALGALCAQTAAPEFEILVVDNGCSDATPQIATSFGARLLHEPVRGPAAARNCGLRAARGAIVAHMDADTVPSRKWLAFLSEPFEDPSVVIVAGNTLCYPPQTAAERYVEAVGLYDATRCVSRRPFPFAPSLNLAIRREALENVGGWSEDLLTGEDVDLCYRILRRFETEIVYAKSAILYHHGRADDAALCRQARGYGAGAADLYRRYPAEVDWNAAKALHLARMICSRAFLAFCAAAGSALGFGDARRAEFLRYHFLWTRNFWLGFAARSRQLRHMR
jgi:glycosyltransferase involved in cell wall biosynthesis